MEVAEGKSNVLKKTEAIGLGDFMVPQAFKTLLQQRICH